MLRSWNIAVHSAVVLAATAIALIPEPVLLSRLIYFFSILSFYCGHLTASFSLLSLFFFTSLKSVEVFEILKKLGSTVKLQIAVYYVPTQCENTERGRICRERSGEKAATRMLIPDAPNKQIPPDIATQPH